MNAQIATMQKELESKNHIIDTASEAAFELEAASDSRRLVSSLQDENGQLKAKVSALEGAVHELEKTVKKMKGGLKERASVNITGPHNAVPVDSRSKDTAQGGHKKTSYTTKDATSYIDMENMMSKDLDPSTTREHSSHLSQKAASHPPQAVGLQLRAAQIAQDIHPGVFSKADKPDRGKPLTRIL